MSFCLIYCLCHGEKWPMPSVESQWNISVRYIYSYYFGQKTNGLVSFMPYVVHIGIFS